MTGADISITREHHEGVMINGDDDEVGSMVKEGEKITFLNILGEQWDGSLGVVQILRNHFWSYHGGMLLMMN